MAIEEIDDIASEAPRAKRLRLDTPDEAEATQEHAMTEITREDDVAGAFGIPGLGRLGNVPKPVEKPVAQLSAGEKSARPIIVWATRQGDTHCSCAGCRSSS